MRIKFDKILGRIREKDSSTDSGGSGGGLTVEQIQELIANSYIDFSQIIGDRTTNLTLKNYIENLINTIFENSFQIGDEITQEMLDYFQTILDQLTITFDQITGEPSINSEFQTFIDNLIQDLTDYINTLVLGNILSEEIKNYIDARLSEIQTVLEQLIATTINNDLREYIEQIINEHNGTSANQTRLISGSVVWMENLDFQVTNLVYEILGQRFTAPDTLVTIEPNESTDPVFAVLFANNFGAVNYEMGIPSVNPLVPFVDPITRIAITPVYIPALGTTPGEDPNGETGEIVTEVIYDENIEWVTAETEEPGITINREDTTDPAKATKHISIAFAGTGSTFVRGALVTDEIPHSGRAFTWPGALNAPFSLSLSSIFGDHKTDQTIAGIRHLKYYSVQNKNQITAWLVSPQTGQSWELAINSFTSEVWEVSELGFSVNIPAQINFTVKTAVPAISGLLIYVYGVPRYDQTYEAVTAENINPTAALVSFTRSEAIDAQGGNIALSVKNSAPWLSNTGLLLELFNDAVKVGSLVIFGNNGFGLNPLYLDYQRITIPIAAFNPTSSVITALQIRPVNAWANNSTLYLDNIVLQTGIKTPNEAPEVIEEARFEYRDVETAGQIYTLDLQASFDYKIKNLIIKTDAGTVTASVKINSVDVTGIAAATATNATSNHTAIGANLVKKNDLITLELAAVDTAAAIVGKIEFSRV
jgi:hypothetical protein